jgi:DNA polymerase V
VAWRTLLYWNWQNESGVKLANYIAKKSIFQGICNLIEMDPCSRDELILNIPVSEVWGVGRKYEKKLNELNIKTVFDLACSNHLEMKQKVWRCYAKNCTRTTRR